MIKVDKTVKRETSYIAGMVAVLSVLLQAVFLIIRKWDYTVLCGNLLGGAAAVFNFLLMGITVQKAVTKDEKQAASLMKSSQTLRMMMLFIIALLGVVLPCFNTWAVLISLLFPRIAIAFRTLFDKIKAKKAK